MTLKARAFIVSMVVEIHANSQWHILRDRQISEPEESTGKKKFRKFEFFTTQKSTFIFLVNIIRI